DPVVRAGDDPRRQRVEALRAGDDAQLVAARPGPRHRRGGPQLAAGPPGEIAHPWNVSQDVGGPASAVAGGAPDDTAGVRPGVPAEVAADHEAAEGVGDEVDALAGARDLVHGL